MALGMKTTISNQIWNRDVHLILQPWEVEPGAVLIYTLSALGILQDIWNGNGAYDAATNTTSRTYFPVRSTVTQAAGLVPSRRKSKLT